MNLAKIGLSAWLCASLLHPAAATEVGIAAFNLAWAGTAADFDRHVEVCAAPSVQWCDSRPKTVKPAKDPTPEENTRAKQCQAAIDQAAGGPAAGMLIAPCNAYKLKITTQLPQELSALYRAKLYGLADTIHQLIVERRIEVLAFQEVKSAEVIREILGVHAQDFEVCVAPHNAFQTVGFAWRKTLSGSPPQCLSEPTLAIKEKPNDSQLLRSLRPGLALTLIINGAPITFMNVHLKSACANLVTGGGFPGRLLTDPDPACQLLNRQIVPLENWIESVASQSPRFVLLGDFNRRLDEEAQRKVPPHQVRGNHTDPAAQNKAGPDGRVTSKYLWQEISDGKPSLYQTPLDEAASGCKGFTGLDHILLSEALHALQPTASTSLKLPVVKKPGQKIPTSDHCPRITLLTL
jgi:hypothetical protein